MFSCILFFWFVVSLADENFISTSLWNCNCDLCCKFSLLRLPHTQAICSNMPLFMAPFQVVGVFIVGTIKFRNATAVHVLPVFDNKM